jgi:hypothetical protein
MLLFMCLSAMLIAQGFEIQDQKVCVPENDVGYMQNIDQEYTNYPVIDCPAIEMNEQSVVQIRAVMENDLVNISVDYMSFAEHPALIIDNQNMPGANNANIYYAFANSKIYLSHKSIRQGLTRLDIGEINESVTV